MAYSHAFVVFVYYVALVVLDYKAVSLLSKKDEPFGAIFLSIIVIQLGLGLIIAALLVDPKTGKNKC